MNRVALEAIPTPLRAGPTSRSAGTLTDELIGRSGRAVVKAITEHVGKRR